MWVLRSPILFDQGSASSSKVVSIESPPITPIASQYKVLLYLPLFGRNSNVKLWPSIFDPYMGVKVDLGGRKFYQLKFWAHIPIWPLCTVWPQYTTDRHSDRNRPVWSWSRFAVQYDFHCPSREQNMNKNHTNWLGQAKHCTSHLLKNICFITADLVSTVARLFDCVPGGHVFMHFCAIFSYICSWPEALVASFLVWL